MIGSYIELNNGVKYPQLGLGTCAFGPNDCHDDCYKAVKAAVDAGYRHFDTAIIYGNEGQVGQAIHDKIAEGVIKREDIFVTTKLPLMEWNQIKQSLIRSLKRLQLDYIDLFLMHTPFAMNGGAPEGINCIADFYDYYQRTNDWLPAQKFSDMHYTDAWKKMEELVDSGLAKTIGVSNFNVYQINRLVESCRILPAMNQVESHPWLTQCKLAHACEQHGIRLTAFAPIGSPARPESQGVGLPRLMDDSTIQRLATEHKKTPAQILIRFAIQRGLFVIAKSAKPERIMENGNVFDFKLHTADMQALFAMNKDQRFFPFDNNDHKYFPFKENYSEI